MNLMPVGFGKYLGTSTGWPFGDRQTPYFFVLNGAQYHGSEKLITDDVCPSMESGGTVFNLA